MSHDDYFCIVNLSVNSSCTGIVHNLTLIAAADVNETADGTDSTTINSNLEIEKTFKLETSEDVRVALLQS